MRVSNSRTDASEGKIIRQWREIEEGYSLVEKPQYFEGGISPELIMRLLMRNVSILGMNFCPSADSVLQ